jgi:hypothetical protein
VATTELKIDTVADKIGYTSRAHFPNAYPKGRHVAAGISRREIGCGTLAFLERVLLRFEWKSVMWITPFSPPTLRSKCDFNPFPAKENSWVKD